MAAFKGLKPSECCIGLPNVFNPKESHEACKKVCPHGKGKGQEKKEKKGDKKGKAAAAPAGENPWCCKAECVVKNSKVATPEGTIDTKLANTVIKAAISSADSNWASFDSGKIVDDCVIQAPIDVEKFKKMIEEGKTEEQKSAMKPCANKNFAVSYAFLKCARNKLIARCPTSAIKPDEQAADKPKCSALIKFANDCSSYPNDYKKDKSSEENSENVQKSADQKEKKEKKDKKDKKKGKGKADEE
jgi:hypothetical protein